MSRLLALAPAALLLASCGHLDEVNVTRTASGTIPGAAGAPPIPGGTFGGLGLTLDRSLLDQNGIRPNDVDSAKLVGLKLAVTQGTSFEAWLDAVSFFIEAPGQPRVLVARKTGIRALPAPTRELELETFGVDLKPYLVASSSTVTAEVSGNQPPNDTTVQATATIRVNVNVTGLLH
jgi:hypothetical protein